jgi:hypothetical protein
MVNFIHNGDFTVNGQTNFTSGVTVNYKDLELYTTENFNEIVDTINNQTIYGNFFGLKNENNIFNAKINSGVFSGLTLVESVITGDTVGHFTLLNKDNDLMSQSLAVVDGSGLGFGDILENRMTANFYDGVSGYTNYNFTITKYDSGRIEMGKSTNDYDIGIRIDDTSTAVEILNANPIQEDSVFKILDNDFQEIIDVTQLQIIMEKVVNYDYADDATAQSNNVPIGGIYHTSGTLKIRIS